MNTLSSDYIKKVFVDCKDNTLSGRWITLDHLKKVLVHYENSSTIAIDSLGVSEEKRDIFQITLGQGKRKVLIWTQMHGNESTGTKAVIDFLSYIEGISDVFQQSILSECTIKVIPILNPDGAQRYTRVNANKVDLNRDAVNQNAKESQLLRSVLDNFQPNFCFNMHDQRTIFGVQGTENPATLSFLAPSEEVTRAITESRKVTMNVIAAMNHLLQQIIPNHIGRYTDKFYPTATGDNFQKLGFPTILMESGHYPEDYEREEVRRFTFYALLQGLYHIATADHFDQYKEYFSIPNNHQRFRDILHIHSNAENEVFQYEEKLQNNEIHFIPKRVEGDNSSF